MMKMKPQPSTSTGRVKKKKQPTQHTPQQRIKIIGADGKVRFEWRDWPPKSG